MKRFADTLFVSIASLVVSAALVRADCVSLVGRPEWPSIARALSSAQVCEQLPAGPNRTKSFLVQSAELCRGMDQNSTLSARAILTCESPPEAFFDTLPMETEIFMTIVVNERTCQIINANVQIGGKLGGLLGGFVDTSEFARNWRQSELVQFCPRR